MTQKEFRKIDTTNEGFVVKTARLRPYLVEGSDAPFGLGIVEFGPGDIPFDLTYDEALVCLEGEVTVSTKDNKFSLTAGEALWMPADQKITYLVPKFAKLLYVTHEGPMA